MANLVKIEKTNAAARKPAEVPSVAKTAAKPASSPELCQQICETAYQLYEKRGCAPGHDVSDWLEAEKIVLEQVNCQSHCVAK